jgi:hypothetical protein
MTETIDAALFAGVAAMRTCADELQTDVRDAALLARSAIAGYLRATKREDEAMQVVHIPV